MSIGADGQKFNDLSIFFSSQAFNWNTDPLTADQTELELIDLELN